MNKKDTADLAELVSNLNKSIADIENGRFEIDAISERGKFATFMMYDKHHARGPEENADGFTARWYTLKRNDGLTCYNPEILDRVNRFIVERRGR